MLKFGNDILKVGTSWIDVVDYNPLNLPSHTIRLLYEDNIVPTFNRGTAVQISESPNIWDLTYEGNNWQVLLHDHLKLIEVLGANTTGVTGMRHLFGGCEMLTSVAIFDTSSVTDMRQLFDGCVSLKSIPRFNTSNVTDMYGMFGLCASIVTIPEFDTSKVTNMGGMFDSNQSLITIPLLDTSSVTGMSRMFNSCESLTSVPLIDTSNVIYMDYMFRYCSSLEEVPLLDTSSVTAMDRMFKGCTNVESGALALYQQASTQDVPPIQYAECFRDCGSNTTTGAAELEQIPSDWK